MRRLTIKFPHQNIEILAVPDQHVALKRMARHRHAIILKGEDGRLYCTGFSRSSGHMICDWDSDRAMDYLPALHRLGSLPKGFTIKAARKRIQERDKTARRRRHIRDLHAACRALGVKPPRVK